MIYLRKQLPIKEIANLYENGMSENKLSKKYGVDRKTIRSRLEEAEVHIRNQSESEALKWSQMTEKQRAYQVKAAHKASKGKKHSKTERFKMALSRQQNPKLSYLEKEFLDIFNKQGLHVIPQYALESYNIDFAIPERKIAIEIDGGNWHNSKSKIKYDRGKELLLSNRGWILIRASIHRKLQKIQTSVENESSDDVILALLSFKGIVE